MQEITENSIVDDRYRVLGRLGSGGMADVYMAEDTHLGRKVALKVLYHRFAQDREFVERFRREASAAASLQHPNVVNVFDRGEFGGTYYIAMEYLEGKSLKALIGEGLSVERAVGIARQILAAARFAHKRGVIHRDFKPHNVIVDADDRAKVTDFGIARAGSSEMTEAGSIMGTAQYLSPEQAQGLPVTAASDLYSIGVILYEMLTGSVPFDGDSAVAVALKQVSEAPLPPRRLNPRVPPALEAVTMRALEKDPARRYAEADEFLGDLEYSVAHPDEVGQDTAAFTAVVPEQPPPPVPPPPPPGVPKQPSLVQEKRQRRRGRWIALAAGVLLVTLIAIWFATRPEKVTVPDVIGQSAPTATQLLENRGFDVDIKSVQSSLERDTVLEQDPLPNRVVEKGSTVILTVSAGPGTVEVPDVGGLTVRSAQRRLRRAELESDVRREFSDTVDKGTVIKSEPEAGFEIKRGSQVTLLVSKGPETVEVPSVVGESQELAETAIRNAGLVPDVVERDADEPEGDVINQTPGGDSKVKKGSTVTLFVSTGAGAVEVPNVVGRSQRRATDILHGAGLRVTVETTAVDEVNEDGLVIEQGPAPGERAKKGDRVTITVGQFEPPPDLGLEGE